MAPLRFVYVIGEFTIGLFMRLTGPDTTSSSTPTASTQYQYMTPRSPVTSRYASVPPARVASVSAVEMLFDVPLYRRYVVAHASVFQARATPSSVDLASVNSIGNGLNSARIPVISSAFIVSGFAVELMGPVQRTNRYPSSGTAVRTIFSPLS